MNIARKQLVAVAGFLLMGAVLSPFAQAQVSPASLVKPLPTSGEQLYVHTDKKSYLAGEIIWFKLYYLQAGTYLPLDLSKVAYVELLDRQSKPVLQAKIAIDQRGGSGSFYLPPSVASDQYVLRAYTRWMRNTGSQQFFETPLTVFNTVTELPEDRPAATAPSVHFYPEGGQFLAGMRSVIGFRMDDANGRPSANGGVIVNAAGDTVARFDPFRFGLGRVELTADASETYTARWEADGKMYSKELPRPSARGYAMKVLTAGTDRFDVEIYLQGLDQSTETMSLVVHTGTRVSAAQQIPAANNQKSNYSLTRDKLSEGVNYITLFNQRGEPVCERLIFIRPAQTNLLKAVVSENNGRRSRVDLDLEALAGAENKDSLNLSIAVYQAAPWEDAYSAGMASHRWLLPALQGQVQSPEFYFSNEEGVDKALDNLLLTHGWRSFDQKANDLPARPLIPELKGHLVTGRVVRKSDGSPVPGELCYLSAPGYPYDLESARSDRQGWVSFEVDNYYGPGEIVVKAASDSAAYFRIDILSPYSEAALQRTYLPPVLNKTWTTDLQQRSVAMQALNIYRADSLRRFSAPVPADTLPFYGKAEYVYKLDDYKRFTTVEEVLREFVAPVGVVSRGGQLRLSIIDELYKRTYDENVMVLIDGIPLTDHNKVFSYDPLKMKKLEVVTRRYVLGSANVGGIASFETYGGRFDAFELDPAVIMLDYEGLQLQRSFYAPDYSVTNNPRIPDFRSTLYWNPKVIAAPGNQQKLSFYTGDQTGRFRVVIQGVSDSGKMVQVEKTINVNE